jgi:hypothetical protein
MGQNESATYFRKFNDSFTNIKGEKGKIEVKLMIPQAEADKVKNRLFYSDAQMTQGIKNNLLVPNLLLY